MMCGWRNTPRSKTWAGQCTCALQERTLALKSDNKYTVKRMCACGCYGSCSNNCTYDGAYTRSSNYVLLKLVQASLPRATPQILSCIPFLVGAPASPPICVSFQTNFHGELHKYIYMDVSDDFSQNSRKKKKRQSLYFFTITALPSLPSLVRNNKRIGSLNLEVLVLI